MQIVVFETEDWEERGCERLRSLHDFHCTREPLTPETAKQFTEAEVISVFIGSQLTSPLLKAFPRLTLIATRSTGVDHIDLEYCRERGIRVCNVPDYGDATVAEHAFALLLSVARKIPESLARVQRLDFDRKQLRGIELQGRRLGVLGTGRIGRRAAQIGRGFGMEVVAYDKRQDDESARAIGFVYLSLQELLATSDVVTIHLPATPQTFNLLDRSAFASMKRGSILINTARGNIVDAEALLWALQTGILWGAGLDVVPGEPLLRDEAEILRSRRALAGAELQTLLADHLLLRMQNVIITPHNAYNTEAALHRIIQTTLDNIEAFLAGAPRNAVV
jgi:D-lactate dehydrogenase